MAVSRSPIAHQGAAGAEAWPVDASGTTVPVDVQNTVAVDASGSPVTVNGSVAADVGQPTVDQGAAGAQPWLVAVDGVADVDASGSIVGLNAPIDQGAAGVEAWPVDATGSIVTVGGAVVANVGQPTVDQGVAGTEPWPVAVDGVIDASGSEVALSGPVDQGAAGAQPWPVDASATTVPVLVQGVPSVADDYSAWEFLPGQLGTGAVLIFTFSEAVQAAWVGVFGVAGGQPCFAAIGQDPGPAATDAGAPVYDGQLAFVGVASEVRVWAPAAVQVRVWGARR